MKTAKIPCITPPEEAGRYSVVYTIENQYGGTSTNFVTVAVDPDAPLAVPVASDTVLTVAEVLDRSTIDVDVLGNVFFADGDVSELALNLVPGYSSSAQVLADGSVRVSIEGASQIIPFSVAHPEDSDVRAFAFLWVPGYDDALPQLRLEPLVHERGAAFDEHRRRGALVLLGQLAHRLGRDVHTQRG